MRVFAMRSRIVLRSYMARYLHSRRSDMAFTLPWARPGSALIRSWDSSGPCSALSPCVLVSVCLSIEIYIREAKQGRTAGRERRGHHRGPNGSISVPGDCQGNGRGASGHCEAACGQAMQAACQWAGRGDHNDVITIRVCSCCVHVLRHTIDTIEALSVRVAGQCA